MATILYICSHGTDDPTRASIPFLMALGAVEAGHQAQIALAGEASYLMREGIAAQVQGVGVPALSELWAKAAEQEIPIHI